MRAGKPFTTSACNTSSVNGMDKIFTPNRWFVLFCALLIVIFGALTLVQDMHVAEFARQKGTEIFTWSWPSMNWQSNIVQVNSHVLRRDANDAVVEVTGRQVINGLNECETKAVLTLYRLNSKWELGKVELK